MPGKAAQSAAPTAAGGMANKGAPFDEALFRRLQADAKDGIRRDARLTMSARTIGAEIMDLINTERRYAWPSERYLAEKIGVEKRTVIRAIDQLRAAGWLLRWRVGRANRYVPRWLGTLEDALSRQVFAQAAAADGGKGVKLSPIGGGKVTRESPIDDQNVTEIGDKMCTLPPDFTPRDIPLARARPGLAGSAPARAAVGETATQKQLPLLTVIDGRRPAPTAENAAHERLTSGLLKGVGAAYGDLVGWISPELERDALAAEIAAPGSGVALVLKAFLSISPTAAAAARSEGAARSGRPSRASARGRGDRMGQQP